MVVNAGDFAVGLRDVSNNSLGLSRKTIIFPGAN